MKSRYKNLYISFFFVLFFIFMIIPNKSLGVSPGYIIKDYNVEVTVNENNSFDIVETITANFSEEKHGIIRKIPTSNSIVRNDGSKAKNHAFVTNIEVSDSYSKSSSSDYISLKIGSSAKTLLGDYTYTIKYKYYIIGKDGLENADELYFNLIGTEWDTSIENVNFKVNMPKDFDSSLLGFSSGYKGSQESSNVEYKVDGKIITGRIKNPLKSNQGLTIRLTLPDKYFFNILSSFEKNYMKIVLIIGSLFLLRAFILWFKYGKDEKVIETVEFYPPKGYNSAEIGYMYNGKATNEAIISTLVQLANKGYIKIEEIEKKGVINTKTFRIIKLKNYDENDYVEKTFFNGLFKYGEPDPDVIEKYIRDAEIKGEKISRFKLNSYKRYLPIKVVTEKNLKNKFYTTINSIKRHLEYNKDEIYEKNDKKQHKIKSTLKNICFLALCNIFIQSNAILLHKILTVVVLQFSIVKLFNIIFFDRRKTVGNLLSVIIFGGLSTYFIKNFVYPCMILNAEVKQFYIIVLVGMIVLAILNILMSKRTAYGTQILGQIKGFRRFLENAEKGQLETLVEENPEYFYDILPYTYALGVSKKWMKQFETIAIQPPEWYDSSYSSFNTNDFTRLLDNTMKDVSDSMTFGAKEYHEPRTHYSFSDSSSSYDSSSSDSSSSYNSGGGSSGGGSGGRRRKLLVSKKKVNLAFF